jgi:hypothetical protein
MLLEMDGCRGCGDGGGCEVGMSGDDGWRCSLRLRASHARVPSQARAPEAPKYFSLPHYVANYQPTRTYIKGEPKQCKLFLLCMRDIATANNLQEPFEAS